MLMTGAMWRDKVAQEFGKEHGITIASPACFLVASALARARWWVAPPATVVFALAPSTLLRRLLHGARWISTSLRAALGRDPIRGREATEGRPQLQRRERTVVASLRETERVQPCDLLDARTLPFSAPSVTS
ncbi:unnamed protein product [Prorocentrum cordatum]|uniref:Uncharacterized protein n=1 Tax=Prorocentrum cordatum TaxID=2364126 RepID=A0ABN9S534_9DINO|nr:unnamed protein product [Polarella glacialis]